MAGINANAWFYRQSFHGNVEMQPPETRIRQERTRFCDECGEECAQGHNVPDRAFFCCICYENSAKPYIGKVERCDFCKDEEGQ